MGTVMFVFLNLFPMSKRAVKQLWLLRSFFKISVFSCFLSRPPPASIHLVLIKQLGKKVPRKVKFFWFAKFHFDYRIIPDKRPPFLFIIAYYKELKEKSEDITEINAKKQ